MLSMHVCFKGAVPRLMAIVFIPLAAGALVVTGGCAESHRTGGPPTHKATATVVWKGEPVEGANVVFAPLDEAQGVAAYGRTDRNGVVELTTFENGDGAVAGSYRVTVTKLEQRMPDVPAELKETDPNRYDDLMIEAGKNAGPPVHLLPAKYASSNTTDLTAEVREGGENSFQFELSGDAK